MLVYIYHTLFSDSVLLGIYTNLVFGVVKFALLLLRTKITMTMTVTAAISATTATATTPPMIAPVLSVLVSGEHILSMLSAWHTSEAEINEAVSTILIAVG